LTINRHGALQSSDVSPCLAATADNHEHDDDEGQPEAGQKFGAKFRSCVAYLRSTASSSKHVAPANRIEKKAIV
jgi:hypothetical protein